MAIQSSFEQHLSDIDEKIAGVLGRRVAVPSGATDPGAPGEFAVDSSYLYVCIDTGDWVVFAADAWPS